MVLTTLSRLLAAGDATEVAHSVRHWIFQLGGIGLIPLGLLDASVVPLPGSMDVLTIILASRDGRWWFYYAAMATIGSVAGAFITFRLAQKGGEKALESRFSPSRAKKIVATFEKWGFWSIGIAALLPPPIPLVPFVIAAGATQYSRNKFLIALTVGRAIRYTILALLAEHYGRQIIGLVRHPEHPYLFGSIAAVVIVGVIVSVVLSARKPKPKQVVA
jgi:membrane protein YqaA with SNARE-associated domain